MVGAGYGLTTSTVSAPSARTASSMASEVLVTGNPLAFFMASACPSDHANPPMKLAHVQGQAMAAQPASASSRAATTSLSSRPVSKTDSTS